MSFRFIHSSDLHLGRRFLNLPEPQDGNLRGRLVEARFDKIQRLAAAAAAARTHGAAHILLATDTFDTATPSPQVLRQALAAMRDEREVTWWLLPGYHDNMRNTFRALTFFAVYALVIPAKAEKADDLEQLRQNALALVNEARRVEGLT